MTFMESFFDGGGYDFLVKLERQFDDCSSICSPPLFYLTKDISMGMPEKECIDVATQDYIN